MSVTPDSNEDIEFDQSLLEKIRIGLAAAEGYELSVKELRSIFGINATHFARLPKRLVVPVLDGNHHTQHWYRARGWLYILEPKEWVPVVRHGQTIAASAFTTSYTKTIKTLSEAKFNAGCKAKVSLGAGGSYYGVTASVELSTECSFDYSSTTTTEEELEMKGIVGKEPVHLLHVYPILRCKAVARQRIDYTINDSSEEMKWDEKSYNVGYWDAIRIASNRLGSVKRLQFHPVPMDGNGLGHKAYMLPVPQIDDGDDFTITTLLSRRGWKDWYIYEEEFHMCSMTIDLAAPENDGAFRPASSWTTLEGRDGKGSGDESEDTEDNDTNKKSKGRGKTKKKGKGKQKPSRYSSSEEEENSESSHSDSEGGKGQNKTRKGKNTKGRPGKIAGTFGGKIDCALTPPDTSD